MAYRAGGFQEIEGELSQIDPHTLERIKRQKRIQETQRMIKDALQGAQQIVSPEQYESPRIEMPRTGLQLGDWSVTTGGREGEAQPPVVNQSKGSGKQGQWTGDPNLDWIIQKESGGRTTAKNPKSSAFGLGQLIIANRKAYGQKLGIDPNTTNFDEQLALMKAYITDRYGSPEKAKDFWERNGWY